MGGLRRSGTLLAICFSARLSPTSCHHFTRINWRVSSAISSPQIPPSLSRRSDPRLASTGFRPFGIPRPPKTTLRHLHPSGSFVKISAHPRALVDSSSFLASINHRRVRRIGPISDWWPTIRPQSTRKARDDSPEPHRLPRARARWLCQLHRQRLGLRPSVNHRLDARKGGHSTPRACPASGKQAEKKIAAERSTELLIA